LPPLFSFSHAAISLIIFDAFRFFIFFHYATLISASPFRAAPFRLRFQLFAAIRHAITLFADADCRH